MQLGQEAKVVQFLRDNELEKAARVLRDYRPLKKDWQEAKRSVEEFATNIEIIAKEVDGKKFLHTIGAFQKVKEGIPMSTAKELLQLPITKFPLGLIYVTPFEEYKQVFGNWTIDDSKAAIQKERATEPNFDIASVYGEILFLSFADLLLNAIQAFPDREFRHFVDLGSGCGTAVFAAAKLYPFENLTGIEKSPALHDRALQCKEKTEPSEQILDFINDDLLKFDLKDADIVFCHATCFDQKLWRDLSIAAEHMKKGSLFISTSYKLSSALFEIVETKLCRMQWGMATVYIHRRRPMGRWASQLFSRTAQAQPQRQPPANTKREELRR